LPNIAPWPTDPVAAAVMFCTAAPPVLMSRLRVDRQPPTLAYTKIMGSLPGPFLDRTITGVIPRLGNHALELRLLSCRVELRRFELLTPSMRRPTTY
jgi:hypothetical protein